MASEALSAIHLPRGGVVFGLGTDLIECTRIAKILERQGERFLERVYTPLEREYCMQMRNPVPHLAARFAAKEAVSKCFTTGIGGALGWRGIEVVRGERGEPTIRLDEAGQQLLESVDGRGVLITLTHTKIYGHAVAILYR